MTTKKIDDERINSICNDAMANAQRIYEKHLANGIPEYKAKMVLEISEGWCKLVRYENEEKKPEIKSALQNYRKRMAAKL